MLAYLVVEILEAQVHIAARVAEDVRIIHKVYFDRSLVPELLKNEIGFAEECGAKDCGFCGVSADHCSLLLLLGVTEIKDEYLGGS